MAEYVIYKNADPRAIFSRMLVVTDISTKGFAPDVTFRDLINIWNANPFPSNDMHPILFLAIEEEYFSSLVKETLAIEPPSLLAPSEKKIVVRMMLSPEGFGLGVYLDEGEQTENLIPIRDLPISAFLDATIVFLNEMEVTPEFVVGPENPHIISGFDSTFLNTHLVVHEIFHEACLRYEVEESHPKSMSN